MFFTSITVIISSKYYRYFPSVRKVSGLPLVLPAAVFLPVIVSPVNEISRSKMNVQSWLFVCFLIDCGFKRRTVHFLLLLPISISPASSSSHLHPFPPWFPTHPPLPIPSFHFPSPVQACLAASQRGGLFVHVCEQCLNKRLPLGAAAEHAGLWPRETMPPSRSQTVPCESTDATLARLPPTSQNSAPPRGVGKRTALKGRQMSIRV